MTSGAGPSPSPVITLRRERAQAVPRAVLDALVQVRVGPAPESLPKLGDENPAPFDLVFIDADKSNNPRNLEWALRLTSTGGLIVVTSPGVVDRRAMIELVGSHPRLTGTALQTVGSKGHDGFALARVLA